MTAFNQKQHKMGGMLLRSISMFCCSHAYTGCADEGMPPSGYKRYDKLKNKLEQIADDSI